MILSRAEGRWLIIAVGLILLAANLPTLLGFLTAPHGTIYTGIDSTAPGDVNVYLSYLEQVRQGHLGLRDLYTPEPQAANIISPFWVGLGLLGQLLGLSPLATYLGSRVILGAMLLVLLYWLAAHVYADVLKRKLAFLLAAVAGGIGAWLAPLLSALFHGGNLEQFWPMDLWVSEGYTFLSLHHSPHFLAATILILLAVAFLARSIERGSLRDGAKAGAAMLALYSFHPFHVLSLGMVSLGFSIFGFARFGRGGWRRLAGVSLAWGVALPAIVYQAWFALRDPIGSGRALQNLLPTPPLLVTLASYGGLLVAAVFGAVRLWRGRAVRSQLLVVWAMAHALAIYLPVFFNRRVTQGLNVALAFLAAEAVVIVGQRIWSRFARTTNALFVTAVGVAAFAISPLWVSSQDLSFLLEHSSRGQPYFFYLGFGTRDALRWLERAGTDDDVVLSSWITGNFIPGWSGRRVYVGHNVETLHFQERRAQAKAFFGDTASDVERRALLRDGRITYVVVGPWERLLGSFDAARLPELRPAFRADGVTIYRVVTGSSWTEPSSMVGPSAS